MLSKRQYQILNSCANGWELFYFPFAEVNYGGQVFPRSAGPDCLRYEDEGPWSIHCSGRGIADGIVALLQEGLLRVARVSESGRHDELSADQLGPSEFAVYNGYSCLTWQEHLRLLGYGPHEFTITETGLSEIQKREYHRYDAELGHI